MNNKLLSASKDSTVCLSTITSSSIECNIKFDNIHESVVKSVKFQNQNENVFASAGNDMEVKIIDIRIKDKYVVDKISDFCNYCVNSIQWNPVDNNILMCASFDPKIYLFDIRNTKKSCIILEKHCSPSTTRTSIYTP